jgi:hypothetical protein
VLGVGLLGGFGRILEKYTRMSIRALDYFAQYNTHATQYSLIAQSLLTTALEYLEKRELQERMRRTESSSQLFGLLPHDVRQGATASPMHHRDSQSQAAAAVASTVASMSSPVARRSDLMVDSFHSQGSTSAAAAAAAAASVAQQQQHQHHHQQQQQHQQATAAAAAAHVHTHSPQLGDLDGAFFGLGDSLMATPETNFWSTYQGYGHDPGTALNLFPLLDSGGGIDLAHYF